MQVRSRRGIRDRGQGMGMISSLKPAAQVIADIIKEAEAVLKRPPLAQDGRA